MLYKEGLERIHRIVRAMPALQSSEQVHITEPVRIGENGIIGVFWAIKEKEELLPVQLRTNLAAAAYNHYPVLRTEVDRFVGETFKPSVDELGPESLRRRWIDPAAQTVISVPGYDPGNLTLVLRIRPASPEELAMFLGNSQSNRQPSEN